jgi:hypothetical protein
MLALCAAGQRDAERVRAGVVYLFDRANARGGWTIGTPEMLGKPVSATIQDTAVALLALRQVGIDVDEPHVASAVKYLADAVAQAQTPAELAWGAYGLRGWGTNVDAALSHLDNLQAGDGSWAASPFVTAAALLAHKEIQS